MLQIKHLTKQYDSQKGVFDLSLEIKPGDLYAFIGHNGAGKTTTLKCLAGIHDFNEGEIILDGLSIKDNPLAFKKKIAYIPDNPDIYEFLSGMQYLNLICDIYAIDTATRKERIMDLSEKFGLTQALNQLISSYSHGMKQKLVLISALIHEPELLILDEPFVGLDPSASLTLKNIMKEMCAQNKIIFFSTHVLEVAEKLCTKVAMIKQGKLICSGSMEEVKGNESLENVFMELTENENHI